MSKKPYVLCILDGWGEAPPSKYNAIHCAQTPHWDALKATYPLTHLKASEEAVGLPPHQMGNSEVGHMTIGSGRVVFQDLPRITQAFQQGELGKNPVFQHVVDELLARGTTAHVMGLLSPGGVHSHQEHLVAMSMALARSGIPVVFHAFLDGRDTPPQSAYAYMELFLTQMKGVPSFTLGTVTGRYYAMDRDHRWDRVEKAYGAMVKGEGVKALSPLEAIRASYAQGVTDEFMLPTVLEGYTGIKQGDGLLMGNFRADRVRQLLSALLLPTFQAFPTVPLSLGPCLGMMTYADVLTPHIPPLFPPQDIKKTLGEVVADQGLTQLRIAETEKYAHVTFFFNGGREVPFKHEERLLIPSPQVVTYDLAPEMSADAVTDRVVESLQKGLYDVIILNYANTDMVGHTGNLAASIKAVEAVDRCLGRLTRAVLDHQGILMITADHGNVEQMVDETLKEVHTAHTCNGVPFLVVGSSLTFRKLKAGTLSDIAPTLLEMMGMISPPEMTGQSLIIPKDA